MREIGQYLVEGREKAGMPLEQVSRITRIQPKFLQALEEGRLDDLPAPAIARGFLVAYCQAVGLDPEPALALLAEYNRNRRTTRPNERGQQKPFVGPILSSERESSVNWTYLVIVLVFMVGILVAILTVGTGPGLEDVSRVIEVPKVQHLDLPPHG